MKVSDDLPNLNRSRFSTVIERNGFAVIFGFPAVGGLGWLRHFIS